MQFPTLRLPFDLPPSTNKMYRRGGNRKVVLSNAARSYKEYVALMAKQQDAVEPLACPLAVSYRFYGSRQDFDNNLKVLNDALNGMAWVDDRQIIEAHIYVYRAEKDDPRVDMEVTAL